jgi:hypothetical protein
LAFGGIVIHTADEYSALERSLVCLMLEHDALFYDAEWHLMIPEVAEGKGKLNYWYMRQLNVGTKGLQKLIRRLCEKGLVERNDLKRGQYTNSFAMRYLLTSRGEVLARELLKEREVYPIPKEQFMRVLVKSEEAQIKEKPLFAIQGGAIVSLDAVTIKKEIRTDPARKEYIFVKDNVVVITKQVVEGHCKIMVKGLKIDLDPEIYEKAKRVCSVTEDCKDFEYCLQTPLTDECFSSITALKQGHRAKRIFGEWKTKSAVDRD